MAKLSGREWRAQRDREWAEAAAKKQADKAAQRQANLAAHQARIDAHTEERRADRERKQDPLNDPHVLMMADKLHITPQEFLDLQAQRRKDMAKIPPYEEQLERFRAEAVGKMRRDH